MKRGDPEQLKLIFGKYASRLVDGEPFMTGVDFLVRYLGIFPEQEYNKHSAHLLRQVPCHPKQTGIIIGLNLVVTAGF